MRNISLPTGFSNLISLDISLDNQGGTINVTTLDKPDLEVNDEVVIQGMDCVVERIGPNLSSSDFSYKTECRIGVIPNKYVSVVYENISGRDSYSLAQILADVASQAGVTVSNGGVDYEVTEFSAAGTFLSVAASLADQMCGILTYQNGGWAVIRKTASLGDFSIDFNDVVGISQHAAGDALDEVQDTANDLKDTLIEADDYARELDDLEEQLRKAQEELNKALNELGDNDSEDEVGITGDITETDETPANAVSPKANPLGRVNVGFGLEPGGGWRQVDGSFTLDLWTPDENWQDIWTPEEATGDTNPQNPDRRYFRVDDVLDFEKVPTGDKKGIRSLYFAKILVPMDEPSNASGLYWMRGTVQNFNVWADPNYWTLCFPVFREIEWTDEAGIKYSDRQMYIELPVWPDPPHTMTDTRSDECDIFYSANLEIVYMPAITNPWDFVGTVDYRKWPVSFDSLPVGMVDVDGNFYNLDGSNVASDISDEADLPGTVGDEQVVLDSNGALVGLCASGAVTDLAGVPFGNNDATFPHLLRKNGNGWRYPLVGWLSQAPVDLAWPGFGGAIPETHTDIESISIGLEAEVLSPDALNYSNYDPHRDPYGDDPDWTPETDTDGDGIPDINDPDADGDGIPDANQDQIDSLRDQIDDLEDSIFAIGIKAAAAEIRLACLEAQLAEYGLTSDISSVVKNAAKARSDYNQAKVDQDKADVEDIPDLRLKMTTVQTAEAALALFISKLKLTATRTECTFVYNNVLPLVRNLISVPLISVTNHTDSSTLDGITDTDGGIAESVSLSLTQSSAEVTVSTMKYREG